MSTKVESLRFARDNTSNWNQEVVLEVSSLRKTFGTLMAVDNVSLKVEKKRICGVIGPNGAGKTTLVNVISGIFQPSSGTVHLRGQKLDGLRPHQVTQLGVARTYQVTHCFDMLTVLENVMVGGHTRSRAGFLSSALKLPSARTEEKQIREDALRYLDFVGLRDKALYPSTSLPLGQRKLLEVARALASQPEVLLLDESAGGLSTSEKSQLADHICELRDNGMAILLIEHDMQFVMGLCDWVYVLNYGQVIAEGPPEAIGRDERVIAAYLGKEE